MPIQFNSKVLENKKVSSDVYIVKFSTPKEFSFKAGQYILISVMNEDNKKIRRAYSIASNPNIKGNIDLCVKKIDEGLASNYICNLKPGDDVEFFGPAGRFTVKDPDKDIIFIGVGTGITPFVSMLPELLEGKCKSNVKLIKGFRHKENIIYGDLCSNLSKEYPNFSTKVVLSRPKNKDECNFKGYVQDFLPEVIPKNFQGHIYVCGLKEMITKVVQKLKELGLENNQIFFEKYD